MKETNKLDKKLELLTLLDKVVIEKNDEGVYVIRCKHYDEMNYRPLFVLIKPNTIKEENEMLELVKLYKDRKMDKLFKDADAAQSKAWEKDSTYKTLKDLSEKTKTKDGYLFTFDFAFMPDSVREEIDKIQKDREEKEIQLNKLIDEVNAYLSLCETYEQKINALIGFGILDNGGRLNV